LAQKSRAVSQTREKFDLTIFLTEHRRRVVMGICEWVSVIDFGALIGEGTPDEIGNDPKVMKAYLGEEVMI